MNGGGNAPHDGSRSTNAQYNGEVQPHTWTTPILRDLSHQLFLYHSQNVGQKAYKLAQQGLVQRESRS